MQMAAEAWPIGRIGILGQTKECLLERGRLSVRSLQLLLYCRSHPEWWNPDSFDGPEDTYVHHKEDSANYNEGSSMMREATALVWLAVHACEIQNGRASESVI